MAKGRNNMKKKAALQMTEKLVRARVLEFKTIDMTPTWTGLMPAFFAVFENGTEEGKKIAREELMRLAAAVDGKNLRAKGVTR
jgi:hypothetical protein